MRENFCLGFKICVWLVYMGSIRLITENPFSVKNALN